MAVYGATAFVLLQVADLLAEGMGLSDQVLRITTFLVLIGFPIAIVLAWAFETTPEGVRRTQPAAPEEIREIVSSPMKQRWPAGLLALLGMGLLFWGGWWMGNRGAENPANILVPAAEASDFKTIAALPFENMNGDEDNRLIAMGIHDDLLNQLQRISALRVSGRTSVREYENTEKTFEQIAGELGVDYLLDASYRRAADVVRVNVALLDASSGEQLWTEQYDRSVTPQNLFDIQSQIAREVVDALEAKLTPQDEASLASVAPAADLAAQTWYVRAIETYEAAVINAAQARDYLLRAIEIDSTFVAAWSRLAHMESRVAELEGTDDTAARAARDRTVELAPGSVEAHLATGFVAYYANKDFDTALGAFREAEKLAPSDADVVWAVGLILRRQGDFEGSTAKLKRAVELDPRNPLKLETLAENLVSIGATRDADAVRERALSVAPGNSSARFAKIFSLVQLDGDTRRAERLAGELGFDTGDFFEGIALASVAWMSGDNGRTLRILDEMGPQEATIAEQFRLSVKVAALAGLDDPALASVADSFLVMVPESTNFNTSGWRMYALAVTGRRDEAVREIEAAEGQLRRWVDAVESPPLAASVVATYGFLGDLDAGFGWLNEVVERPGRDLSASMLRLNPGYAPYRDDPRFEEIIARREAFEAEGQRKAAAMRPWLP